MMQFNLCMADCAGNSTNCLYPYPITVTDPDVLRASATMDHVCGMYKNNYRSLDTFLWSDVAVMDCDNDHSDNPADWMTPETMAAHLPDVSFAAVPSRNNNKEKGGKAAKIVATLSAVIAVTAADMIFFKKAFALSADALYTGIV